MLAFLLACMFAFAQQATATLTVTATLYMPNDPPPSSPRTIVITQDPAGGAVPVVQVFTEAGILDINQPKVTLYQTGILAIDF